MAKHDELRDLAVDAARYAGDYLLQHFGQLIDTQPKGNDSLVTTLDVDAERLIIDRIRAVYPEHAVIGEESAPAAPVEECTWVVDPIDGTRNFAVGIPMWAVSVAALERGRPVAAAIYTPLTSDMYHAAEGSGAWLDETRMSVSRAGSLAEAVAMTDLSPRDYQRWLPGDSLGGLIRAARRTRMFGSVCCALCYVAAGRFDLYYRPRLNLWDIAAAVLLVREAGGEVRDFDGGEWSAESNSIVAGNRAVVEDFLRIKAELVEQ